MTVSKTPNMTDYEAERRNFHLDVPEQFNFATDVIGKWATDPHKLACCGWDLMAKRSILLLLTLPNIPAVPPTLLRN